MFCYFIQIDSFRIPKNLFDKIFSVPRNFLCELVVTVKHFFLGYVHIIIMEGQFTF